MIKPFDMENMDLPKISWNIFSCLPILLGMFMPGFLFVFLYAHGLFMDLNVIKLVLLSIAFSAPLNIFNCYIADTKIIDSIINTKEINMRMRMYLALSSAGVISSCTITILLVLYYLTEIKVIRTLAGGFWGLILINFAIVVSLIISQRNKKNEDEK